jgi:hypothetical protein
MQVVRSSRETISSGHERITGEAASSCADANSAPQFLHHALADAECLEFGLSIPFQPEMLCSKKLHALEMRRILGSVEL